MNISCHRKAFKSAKLYIYYYENKIGYSFFLFFRQQY